MKKINKDILYYNLILESYYFKIVIIIKLLKLWNLL